MRNSSEWYRPLVKALEPLWPATHDDVKPSLLCQVELGLYLLESLDPSRDAVGVYTLLGGYPFAAASGIAVTPAHHVRLDVARHLLWKLRRRRMWTQCLESYDQLPVRLRGYRLSENGEPARRVEPTIAADRFRRYEQALSGLPDFDQQSLPLAPAGQARFMDRHRPASVNIPERLCFPPAIGHDLRKVPSTAGRPLDIPLDELAETARWMDTTAIESGLRPGSWARRLADVRLSVLSAGGLDFEESQVLRLDRLLHLVGMVGAGKSTLMILIAAWGARKGLRTTLVVGDVAEQLTLVEQFRGLGLAAAPVIGGTTREHHVSRLHRRLASRGRDSLLSHDDPAFDDLSTVCPLDALRGLEAAEPLRYVDAPCTELRPVKGPEPSFVAGIPLPVYRHGPASEADREGAPGTTRDDGSDGDRSNHGCPIWSKCPRHATDRAMVDALIWVANPASLVQSAVPRHLNAERLRRLELACLRSDIIVVDEADRVQMQLDTAFAPSATLIVRGPESWLDRLGIHKIDELARQGRLPLSARDVERWSASLDLVSIAANRLYRMLITDADLRAWADIEYFSAWTLQEKLVSEWYPRTGVVDEPPDGIRTEADVYEAEAAEEHPQLPSSAADSEPWADRRREVTDMLDAFRDDPLGDHGPHDEGTDTLIRRAHDLLHTLDRQAVRGRVRAVLDTLLAGSPLLDGSLRQDEPRPGRPPRDPADTWGTEPWRERAAIRLEFTLVLAALHHRLERVTFLWPQAEAALHLDTADNELSRRPPLDYAPVVPESPMGNVLGFQYLPEDPERSPDGDEQRSGTLRFFRCAGVGRELLLNLPTLGADPASGRPGPHVLLMSGTSWAGTSTRAHVMVPVRAILKPHETAIEAIRRTSFRTLFLYDAEGCPLTLSGAKLDARRSVLTQMVTQLGKSAPGTASPLDRELRRIEDGERHRALLLVGSYHDARVAADLLEGMPRWSGKVRVLAADRAELDHPGPGDTAGGPYRATAVRRGDLATFAQDEDAEILVAPLMAIERGHNILNGRHKAAFGTVFFLARPHPRPDDLSLALFAINDWVTRFIRNQPGLASGSFDKLVADAGSLDAAGRALRHTARKEWRRLLSRRYIYSRLGPAEQVSFAWDQLVTIWQVIGRLVRGGVPARVVFVDAAFAPALAEAGVPTAAATRRGRHRRTEDGLLLGLREVLRPYFDDATNPASFPDRADPALVRTLYQPLYDALCGLRTGE